MSDNLIIKSNVVVGFNDEFVEEIVIPEGVTKIANDAFKKYYGLKRIVFPSTLKSIGESAFEKCSSLETITLSENIETLGDGVFKGCSGLKTADFSKSLIKQLPYECFDECKKLSKVLLPHTTVKVLNRCFTGCKNLTDIQFNEGLKVVEDSFYDCSSLKTLYIPTTVIHLEDISYRRNITTIKTTQEQFEKFKELLPARCELQKVSVVDGNIMDFSSYDDFEIEGTEIVDYIGDDENVTVPFGITQINSQAFQDSSIQVISFPTTLKKICMSAFENCEELERVIFNEGLLTIEYEAFRNCKKLKEISLPSSLVELEEYVFSDCHSVNVVNCNGNKTYSYVDGCLVENGNTIIESFGHKIPENPALTDISDAAFSGYGYFYVTIPENIKNIYTGAFSNCESMETLKIKHDVYIESGAFKCDKLSQLEISAKCVSIEEGAIQVPHNNMLNIYVDDVNVPDGLESCISLVRYNHYCGKLIDPNQKSGSHCVWNRSEWDTSDGLIYPKENLICKGKICDSYYIGRGYNILDSTLQIAIGLVDSRPIWDRFDSELKAKKIKLTRAIVNGIDYYDDIYDGFDNLTEDVHTFDYTVFYLYSEEFLDALKYADEVTLHFELFDDNDNYLEGFYFTALL